MPDQSQRGLYHLYSAPGRHPPKTAANHYRFPLTKISLYHRMVSLLKVVEYELADRQGWFTSAGPCPPGGTGWP